MDGEINAGYLYSQLIHNYQVAWEADQRYSCLGTRGQLGPGINLLAAPHPGVYMQQCLTDFTHLVNLVPAGSMDSESEPKQHNLLGQDRYPTQNMFWQNKKTVAQL